MQNVTADSAVLQSSLSDILLNSNENPVTTNSRRNKVSYFESTFCLPLHQTLIQLATRLANNLTLIKGPINERTPTYEVQFCYILLHFEKPEDDRIEVETCSLM